MPITTSGGPEMAKKIFSNILKSDNHHPMRHIQTTNIYVTKEEMETKAIDN